jgi:hypothetical protein
MIDDTKTLQNTTGDGAKSGSTGRKALGAKALIAAASVSVLFAAGASPAQAISDIDIVSVGSQTAVSGQTVYSEYEVNYTLAVVGNFSAHAANSVTLDSIRICSGSLGGPQTETVWVYPSLYRQDGTVLDLPHKLVPSTGCESWAIGVNYSTQVDGELVRVNANVKKSFENPQTVSFTR